MHGCRREREHTQGHGLTAVNMHLELALRRSIIADANLGGIGAQFKVERQRGHGGEHSCALLQLDIAVNPAGVHDVDSERYIEVQWCLAREWRIAAIPAWLEQ